MAIYTSIGKDGKKHHLFQEIKVTDAQGNKTDLEDPDGENTTDTDYSTDNNNNITTKNTPENDDSSDLTSEDNAGEDEEPEDYSATQTNDNETSPAGDDIDQSESDEPTDYSIPDDDTSSNENDTNDFLSNDEPEDYSQQGDATEETPSIDNSNPEGGDEPEDYSTTDSDSTDGEETQAGEEASGEENNVSDTATEDPLKTIDKDIFSNLTPEQMAIKHEELKRQYLQLYDDTGHVLERLNDLPKSSTTFEIITFICEELSKLRTILVDYLVKTYPLHSYFENLLNYNQYLGVLAGVNQLMDELPAENEEK